MATDLAAEKRRIAEETNQTLIYGEGDRRSRVQIVESALTEWGSALEQRIEALHRTIVECNAVMGDYLPAALDGTASEFALSFGIVQRVDDLRLRVAAQDAEIAQLRADLVKANTLWAAARQEIVRLNKVIESGRYLRASAKEASRG